MLVRAPRSMALRSPGIAGRDGRGKTSLASDGYGPADTDRASLGISAAERGDPRGSTKTEPEYYVGGPYPILS